MDRNSLDSLEPGSPIWRKTASEIQNVVDAYDNYLRVIARKGLAEKEEYKLSQRKVMQLEKLRKQMINMNTEGSALNKTLSSLATSFQSGKGNAGAITRFTDSLIGLGSTVDKSTGMIQLLGRTTTMSAASFSLWTTAVITAAGALITYLDAMDKLRVKQGELMRNLGSTSGKLDIAAPYEAAALGISIAGKAGAEAAQDLQNTITKMRLPNEGRILRDIAATGRSVEENENSPLDKLTRLTKGMSEKTPEYLMKLRIGFAERDLNKMVQALREIGMVANTSHNNVDFLAEQIFAIGQEFVTTGMNVSDATIIMARFADAVGSAGLPMQTVLEQIKRSETELRTSAGVPQLLKNALFAGLNFDTLDKPTQDKLNEAASSVREGATFQGLDVLEQARAFQKLDKGVYDFLISDIQKKTLDAWSRDGIPDIAQQYMAKPVLDIEKMTAEETYKKTRTYGPPEAAASEIADALSSVGDNASVLSRRRALGEADEEFDAYLAVIAARHKEWTAKFDEAWVGFQGSVVSWLNASRLENESRISESKARATNREELDIKSSMGRSRSVDPSTARQMRDIRILGSLLPVGSAQKLLESGQAALDSSASRTRIPGMVFGSDEERAAATASASAPVTITVPGADGRDVELQVKFTIENIAELRRIVSSRKVDSTAISQGRSK